MNYKSSRKKRVVITGIGPICSIGSGKNTVWQNVLQGKTGVVLEKIGISGKYSEEFYLHKIDRFNISEFGIRQDGLDEIKGWKEGRELKDLYYIIAAIKLALDDSKTDFPLGEKACAVVANENLGFGQFCNRLIDESYKIFNTVGGNQSKSEYFKKIYSSFVKDSYDLQSFMSLYHITKLFQLNGYSLFVNNACASGLYALEVASQIINSNKCNTAIVAASDQPDIFKYLWFKGNGMYASDGKIKPFDRDSNGFVLGEGGAAIVIEELGYALKRNAHIYAEYLGGGFLLEGYKVMLPSVGNNFLSRTIELALTESKIKSDEVDFICAHGAGMNIADRYEAGEIAKVFGKKILSPPVTAFKPYVGHNLGGCTLLEIVIMLLSMENNLIPPILNHEVTNSKINLNLVTEAEEREIKVSLKTCCAFAGYDAAVIFRKVNH